MGKFKVGDKVRIKEKATLQYSTVLARGQIVTINEVFDRTYKIMGETFFESELSELTKLEKVMK